MSSFVAAFRDGFRGDGRVPRLVRRRVPRRRASNRAGNSPTRSVGVDRRAAAYRGTVHAFRTVARQEGARGFYAGVVPAVVGSTVSWGVYFTCYNNAKARYRRAHDLEHLPSHLHLASAAEAGLVVSLATNPIWVVKTRLQLQKRRDASATPNPTNVKPYRGFADALAQIARTEGIAGLYKGLGPSVFLVSHGALQFAAYERLRLWRARTPSASANSSSSRGRISDRRTRRVMCERWKLSASVNVRMSRRAS